MQQLYLAARVLVSVRRARVGPVLCFVRPMRRCSSPHVRGGRALSTAATRRFTGETPQSGSDIRTAGGSWLQPVRTLPDSIPQMDRVRENDDNTRSAQTPPPPPKMTIPSVWPLSRSGFCCDDCYVTGTSVNSSCLLSEAETARSRTLDRKIEEWRKKRDNNRITGHNPYTLPSPFVSCSGRSVC